MDLAQRLGVSVITIRQALGHLVHEGYVRREKAKGTFVNWKGPVRQSANLEVEADDLMTLDRASTSFKLISIEHAAPPKEIRQRLPLRADEKVTRIVRIRLSQGQPLAHVVSYVPFPNRIEKTGKAAAHRPPPIIIETVSGINITEVKHAVAARLSDDEVSRHLAISAELLCSGRKRLFAQEGNDRELCGFVSQRPFQLQAHAKAEETLKGSHFTSGGLYDEH